ncbi:sacsin N-terminal ATP-binding-like domain-containing protein [Nocardia sp. CA-135953]|uniref:sacsin N-terminal ATP-binding-like domain-containing protein n=1 Tax=Nocardia sp. CA-135953 TaxID=3239978 RepID=UPI003D981F20
MSAVSAADPFGTSGLRAGVLAAWRDSPTRLREDAATEADLVRAGYRDRLLTELAQNAADAAAKAGVAGRVVVRLVDGAVHISNTGAPLDLSGVHALTALRASGKADPAVSVGRFGVGFTAVRTVSEEIEVRSTTGSIRFSHDLTWKALRDNAITVPDPAEAFTPPVLRLAWPTDATPPPDADTEIVLRLHPDIDPQSLLAAMRAEAVDLLLELPALQSIRIGDDEITSTVTDPPTEGPHQCEHEDPHPAHVSEDFGGGASHPHSRQGVPHGSGDTLATPTRGDADPSRGYADPSHGRVDFRGGNADPSRGYAHPTLGHVDPTRGGADPSGGYADPSDGYAKPSGGYADPSDGHADPSDGHADPSDGHADPSGGRADSGGGDADPSGGHANPGDGRANLTGGDANLSGGRADPSDGHADLIGPHDTHDAESGGTEADLSIGRSAGAGLRELRIDGPGSQRRVWWEYRTARARWLLPLQNGRPVSAVHDVLRAPTRSDEELSLPALLIADIPMQPDRRRVLPGARLAEFAQGYADFARALPPRDRLVLVPSPGFARSEVDGILREALIRELQTHPWLPVVTTRSEAAGETAAQSASAGTRSAVADQAFSVRTAAESDAELGTDDWTAADLPGDARSSAPRIRHAVPTRASVFTGLSRELADLLDDVVGPLIVPELSGRTHSEALAVLDVHRLGLARLAELSAGLERSPTWWHSLYAALEPYVVDPLAAEELGALAVPLADGRLVTGPRTAVLDDQLDFAIPVHWARLVHPEAVHPLLARLGARSATAEDLLSDPGLRAELEDQPGDPDTTDAVLRLAAHTDPSALPSWLGLLELPDTTGELLPADELLLPDAPLSTLLVLDSPFGTVATDLVDRYGAEALRAVGVGWDFSIVVETDPTGPDHHLDDEERWWSDLPEDPPELAAVRDLDLVEESCWPEALRQLASTPRTRELLTDPDGYTTWWLRRHARIDGTPLGLLRHPADTEFAGLLPEFELSGLDSEALRAVLANPNAITQELAAALLDALADPSKTPTPDVVSRTHARLAAAVDHLDLTELELPERVRALSSAVVDPNDAWVLDQPWFGLAVPADHLVAGDSATAPALATLLDLPMVSDVITAEVMSQGRHTTWSAEPLGIVLRQLFILPDEQGDLVLHDDLQIRLRGALEATVSVPWWRDGATTHIRTPHHPA